MNFGKYKLHLTVGFFFGLILYTFFKFDFFRPKEKNTLPVPVSRQDFLINNNLQVSDNGPDKVSFVESAAIKTSNQEFLEEDKNVNLLVPFVVQAPGANWEMPYKEACEEASLLMVVGYLQNKNSFSVSEIKLQIDNLVNFQLQSDVFGTHKDLTITETAQLANKYYQFNFRLIENIDEEKIINELRMGNPIIVPAAGRNLNNPNFRSPGPLYHMLVIKGYNNGFFITNDPGTKNGQDYLYKTEVLLEAIADWTDNGPIGKKIGLVLFE